jgi:hypothetical protein
MIPAFVAADGALSEPFSSSETNLRRGTVVQLKSNSKSVVSSATLQGSNTLLGVVGNTTLIQINRDGSSVDVVVTGNAPVLVSDINGAVKAGDRLAASPIVGVAMKATTAGQIVGVASQNLSQVATTPQSVTDLAGKRKTVKVGLLPSQVGVSYYAPAQDKIKPLLPSVLLTIGRTIAGKDISGIRVIISLLVLLLGFLVVAVMLHAGIGSGITAMGRNPLAHKDIRQGLIDVTVTGIVVLGLTVMGIYIILTS